MNKKLTKIFGLCAVCLIGTTAITHQTANAEDTDIKVTQKASEGSLISTPNRLAKDPSINLVQLDDFINWISNHSITTVDPNNVDMSKNIAKKDVKDEHLNKLFTNYASGPVAQNVGLTLDNPDDLDINDLLHQLFGIEKQLVDDEDDLVEEKTAEDTAKDDNLVNAEDEKEEAAEPKEEKENNEKYGIFLTSNTGGINGDDFKEGDTIKVKFWTNYGIGNANKLKDLGEVNIKVKSLEQQESFDIIAENLTKEVGDKFEIFDGIKVKGQNEEEGEHLKPIVFKQEKGAFYIENDKGAFTRVFKGSDGEFRKELQNADSSLNSKIQNMWDLETGEFYLIEDTSHFDSGNRIKTTTVSSGIFQKRVDRTYNTAVTNFDQELHILIPYYKDNGTNKIDIENYYTNRFITVTNDGENSENSKEEKVALYRAYNPNDGDHLFTTSEKEYNDIVDNGWEDEGIAWYAPGKGKQVYRLYNPNSGEHFYTDSKKEYDEVAAAGWKQEGEAFYSLTNEDTGAVPIYRSFNPNATGPGSHMFTDSSKEYNNLTKAGWKAEGIAFFGVGDGKPMK